MCFLCSQLIKMLLGIFSLFNCVFGGFPFLIKKLKYNLSIKICHLGYFFMFMMLLSFYHACNSPYLCLGFSFIPGFEPEEYHCFFSQAFMVVIFLHRLNAVKRIKYLFLEMFECANESLYFLVKFVKTIIFIFILNGILIYSFFQGRYFDLRFAIDFTIAFYTTKLIYFCTLSQPIFLCYSVKNSIYLFNSFLNCKNFEAKTLIHLRNQYEVIIFLFRRTVKIYAIDIFLILTIVLPDYYLKINELMQTFIISIKEVNFSKLVGTSLFIVFHILINSPGLIWVCELIGKLNQQVTHF